MSDGQTCMILYMCDGRKSRALARYLENCGVPYAVFPRDRIALVPCKENATSVPLLDGMGYKMAANIRHVQRSDKFKAILWRRVRGASPYDSYTRMLQLARYQRAYVSPLLESMVEGVQGGKFVQ